jgi:hypothetical protein
MFDNIYSIPFSKQSSSHPKNIVNMFMLKMDVGNIYGKETCTFNAWIEDYASGIPLSQLGNQTKDNTDTCFVRSEDNRRFSICASVNDTTQSFACHIYIDGQCVGARFLGKWSYGQVTRLIRFEDIGAGPGQIIPLRFGRTKTCGKDLCKFR